MDDKIAVTTECPYCFEVVAEHATRCKHCAGDIRNCPDCGKNVRVTIKQKFVGVLRGGTKTQVRCMECDAVLEGPRF